MSIFDSLPRLIRLPLRAIFGIIGFAAICAVAGAGVYIIVQLVQFLWWAYMGSTVFFWTVNVLLILFVLTCLGAFIEDGY